MGDDGAALDVITSVADADKVMIWDGDWRAMTIANLKKTIAGKSALWIPARKWELPTTNPAGSLTIAETTTNNIPYQYREFSGSATNSVFYNFMPPRAWDEGILTFQVVWLNPAAGTAVVQHQLEVLSQIDVGSLDTALGSAVTVDDNETAADDLLITPESGNLTVGGAVGVDPLHVLLLSRNGAADASTIVSRFIGAKIYYTHDDSNDN